MARKILIVDDMAGNRKLLRAFLCDTYEIDEATNGVEALEYISREYKQLSAVLLDIQMPVMNGFEVVQRIRANTRFSQLPIIVVTGCDDDQTCVEAISLGANDYVTKPYNPVIIKHCLRNNITLYETASMITSYRKDPLTGLLNREFFFREADDLLRSHPAGSYILSCFDIDNFRFLNEQLGSAEGDRILRHIAAAAQGLFAQVGGLCGRISADNFVSLYPNTPEALSYVDENCSTLFAPVDVPIGLHYSIGRCVANDRNLPAVSLYDRALLAKQSIKGCSDRHIAYFDEAQLDSILHAQELSAEMDEALTSRYFEVWYQPQFNHETGRRIGAEALVRWRHSKQGMLLPGAFVPFFEENGFIYELDKYVWDAVCRALRKWLDEGKQPLPVSVNISRCDILRQDFVSVLTGLVEAYRLPTGLLHLEVNEASFLQQTAVITAKLRTLIDYGFTVEIDDFGSGCSSLNILKDVPAQVLKVDMRVWSGTEDPTRSNCILSAILYMVRQLGMTVIAKDVETKQQADALLALGCTNVQGYCYAEPMTMQTYEQLTEQRN